jgi:photosystem II stability/assembly factor-like uncharacterized protein
VTTSRRISMLLFPFLLSFLFLAWLVPLQTPAQPMDPSLFSGMRWRLIGPFRGGRVLAVAGVREQPNLFYFGAVGGGVWKSDDSGRVWTPVFDQQPIASIGAIEVAPSDPNIIYVGSGEADMRSDISHGNGMYKSTDAGSTWKRCGLEDSRQIGRVLIDPHDPNRVFVAALGHAYGPNAERGVFRSTDGGKTWQKVLYKDENTGAIDLAFDSRDPQTIYAALWQTRRPPWNVYPPSNGPGSGLYKSTDGGNSWKQLTAHGLPSEGLGRIRIAVAPSDPARVYLVVDAKEGGLYRSDDAGQNWQRENGESRLWGRGWYFNGVTVDPRDRDTVYVSNTSLYRSRDAGKSFTAIKGAPGGDDYHSLWINPDDPQRMILASDQGAIVSVNGGKSWSSWYNQPTGQFYHVVTDNRFPYWVYGAQQDSGAAGTTSRSIHRGINARDWAPVSAGGENGYVAPDPLNPGIVFGGTVSRNELSIGQDQNISPTVTHPDDYRSTWTLPLVFSRLDPHQLYFSNQFLFRTSDGGASWKTLSPDLTREDPGVPPNLDPATAADGPDIKRRGVIYTIAPSPLRAGEIWIGTDDGLIQVTRDDGKTWHNVTPPELTPWSKIGLIDASRHDPNTFYVAVDRHRLEDYRAHVYRTHDGGKTWKEISNGIPDGSFVNAVREDPARKGLLFAGTETGVFVSLNDGEQWQPLQLNLPNASVRDLVIHEDDLVIGTHGRAFWILDNITPLRQINADVAKSESWFFQPQTAWRVRAGSDHGTPLPPDEPSGENPPHGAMLDYYLKSAPAGPVTFEVFDQAGKPVRRFSSTDPQQKVDPNTLNIPAFWVQPPKPLSAEPQMHRFVWDLHYESVPGVRAGRGGGGSGPWALPGQYTVKLKVADKVLTQLLKVEMDPRIKTPTVDLVKQFEVSQQVNAVLGQVSRASREASRMQEALKSLRAKAAGDAAVSSAVDALMEKMERIAGVAPVPGAEGFGPRVAASDRHSFRYLSSELGSLVGMIQSADVAPGADAMAAVQQHLQLAQKALAAWEQAKTQDLPAFNEMLQKANLPPITVAGNDR